MTAADSRVALHIVQTGGFGPKSNIADGLPSPGFGGRALPPEPAGLGYDYPGQARDVTGDTGGLSFFYTDPRKAFARIGAAISADYLLGYTPSNQHWDGTSRRIDVAVKTAGRDCHVPAWIPRPPGAARVGRSGDHG